MRYINLRLTYLLTYLLTETEISVSQWSHKIFVRKPLQIAEMVYLTGWMPFLTCNRVKALMALTVRLLILASV